MSHKLHFFTLLYQHIKVSIALISVCLILMQPFVMFHCRNLKLSYVSTWIVHIHFHKPDMNQDEYREAVYSICKNVVRLLHQPLAHVPMKNLQSWRLLHWRVSLTIFETYTLPLSMPIFLPMMLCQRACFFPTLHEHSEICYFRRSAVFA